MGMASAEKMGIRYSVVCDRQIPIECVWHARHLAGVGQAGRHGTSDWAVLPIRELGRLTGDMTAEERMPKR